VAATSFAREAGGEANVLPLWSVLAALIPALAVLDAPSPAGPGGLLGLATAAVLGALVVLLVSRDRRRDAHGTASPAGIRALALRTRSGRAAFLRLRDPDARGRTRPRAPTAGPAAA
jgi:hypothetical protein